MTMRKPTLTELRENIGIAQDRRFEFLRDAQKPLSAEDAEQATFLTNAVGAALKRFEEEGGTITPDLIGPSDDVLIYTAIQDARLGRINGVRAQRGDPPLDSIPE